MLRRFPATPIVLAAALLLSLSPVLFSQSANQVAPAGKRETPRLPNGKPDLTGYYLTSFDPSQSFKPAPPYKKEALAKVHELDKTKATSDPTANCQSAGLPRIGPPREILQSPVLTVFVYEGKSGHYYRVIPTDGRPHREDLDASLYGDSVGKWDGDTLVVDATGFDDSTWLGPDGWYHSQSLHVVERFTRQGNALRYEVTVNDPDVFSKPWTIAPRNVLVNTDPDHDVYKVPVCNGKDF